jgi:universal stress protein F
MMKPILVALDDSERAPHVLRAATQMARSFDAPLVLFRAVAFPAVPLAPDGLPVAIDYEDDAERRARRDLEAYARGVPEDIPARVTTAVDIPWQGVCETAKREDCSLIVIGSHGYGGLDRLLGTTAAKVVDHADRAVLVVRDSFPQ